MKPSERITINAKSLISSGEKEELAYIKAMLEHLNDESTKVNQIPTKTPWQVEEDNVIFGKEQDNPVAETYASPNQLANSRHIVKCVNSHEELKEACRQAIAGLEEYGKSILREHERLDLINFIEKALKKAESD